MTLANLEKISKLSLDLSNPMSFEDMILKMDHFTDLLEHDQHKFAVLKISQDGDAAPWPGNITTASVNRWERALRRLEKTATLISVLAKGNLSGPALDLILISDYRICTPDLSVNLPVNEGHIWPGMAIYRLVNQIGLARARHLLFSDNSIRATQALNFGLVDEVTESMSESLSLALDRFNYMSNTEIRIRRQCLLEALSTKFEDARGTYLAACDRELRRLKGDFVEVDSAGFK